MKGKYVIFDLDDTLFSELDYLKSAYKEIALKIDRINQEELYSDMLSWYKEEKNTFELLCERYPNINMDILLSWYRNHYPSIDLRPGAHELLEFIKLNNFGLGLITDGRSLTQRNKLKALNIEHLFDKIVISEEFGTCKPATRNYEIFIQKSIDSFFYIGDNIKKDFIAPNKLGWKSICLKDDGRNIHKQQDGEYIPDAQPAFFVDRFIEIKNIIDKLKNEQ